ncbi:MAG: flagellar hook-basal body complex protein FliE [Phycisphaerales bacterium]
MININPNVNNSLPINIGTGSQTNAKPANDGGFADTIKAVEKQVSNVDDIQKSSEVSIQDLLSGKNEDITTVVTEVAKADMSFKLLVGVRNKLIEAYKQTMNMPI